MFLSYGDRSNTNIFLVKSATNKLYVRNRVKYLDYLLPFAFLVSWKNHSFGMIKVPNPFCV